MFKVDMDAIYDAAIEARLMANPAKVANPARDTDTALADLATLANSQQRSADIDPVLAELLDAAMRACDVWNDSAAARNEMGQEVLQTPPHLRADLLDHLKKAYRDRPDCKREERR